MWGPLIGLVASTILSEVFNHDDDPMDNPTYTALQGRWQAEAERDAAILNFSNMATQVAQLMESVREMENQVFQANQASNSAAAAAEERVREHMNALVEAEIAANAARSAAESAARLATEEAKKKAEEADTERRRTQVVMEEASRATAVFQEEAERLQRAAEEEKKRADEVIADADVAREAAENDAREAIIAKDGAERRLREGIQPVVTPTHEEVCAAQAKIQYQENLFHFAVAGRGGAGKSSLVNAFRGMTNHEASSAQTGVTETTMILGRYPGPDEWSREVWYDLPGAGTLLIPDWQYFNAQGLYVFDCIVVLFDNRFTQTDIAILLNSRRFQIPTYIVRSKADQHIRNIMEEMGYYNDDNSVEWAAMYATAREQFINETRHNVKENLAAANLPNQQVYIVSSNRLRNVAKGERPKRVIDELHLFIDLYSEAQARRVRRKPADTAD